MSSGAIIIARELRAVLADKGELAGRYLLIALMCFFTMAANAGPTVRTRRSKCMQKLSYLAHELALPSCFPPATLG